MAPRSKMTKAELVKELSRIERQHRAELNRSSELAAAQVRSECEERYEALQEDHQLLIQALREERDDAQEEIRRLGERLRAELARSYLRSTARRRRERRLSLASASLLVAFGLLLVHGFGYRACPARYLKRR